MSVKIKLKHPILSVAKATITEVEIRQPVIVGDWRVASRASGGSADERMFQLVCRMSGLVPSEVEQMHMSDFSACSEAIDFGDPDPKAPSASSESSH